MAQQVQRAGSRGATRRAASRLALLFLGLALAGCAGMELVELPAREADLFPRAQRRAGVSVAADEIADAARLRRHFGRNLLADDILPVRVVVSNHGAHPVLLGPGDVLVTRGREVLDPLPVEHVLRAAKPRSPFVAGKAREELASFLRRQALEETVLAPGESYQGLVFLDATASQDVAYRFLRVLGAHPRPRMRLELALTDLETSGRLRFGPFPIYR
jgi:hypothetical protein